jgi:xylulose-5-phosphate/fructose-6-phosphate phosphoketolase
MKGIFMTSAAFTDSIKFSATSRPLSKEELRKMNDYWRAANYLSVGQIYLYDNPLLREPLKLEHIKPRLL